MEQEADANKPSGVREDDGDRSHVSGSCTFASVVVLTLIELVTR